MYNKMEWWHFPYKLDTQPTFLDEMELIGYSEADLRNASGRLMRCWTIRLASLVALCPLACSGAKSTTSPTRNDASKPAPIQDAASNDVSLSVADAADSRMIKVEAFDCERQESFPGEPPQSGLVLHGIRGWHSGGPEGASWNVDDLRCTVRVTTTCSRGDVEVALRVGRMKVAENKGAIGGSQVDLEIIVPFKKWKANFDDQKPARRPFDTAVLRVVAALNCTAPFDANWKNSNYRDVTDEDMFVAGFAYGE